MSHRISASAVAVGLLACGLAYAPTASALPLLNGDFSTFVPSNGTGGDWTSSLIDANGGWRSTTSENSFENFFILNFNGTGTDPALSQIVTGLVVGDWYSVTGEFESFRPGDGDPNALSFGVEIVGVALEEYQRPPSLLGDFELTFQASATSHALRLTAERNGDDSAYAVDNIAMVPTDPPMVPEPSIGALLGTGGLALFGQRMRRRSHRRGSARRRAPDRAERSG